MAKETSEALELSGQLMRERVRARLVGARPEPVRIGRFELLRACGRGGQGLVYDAWDTVTHTHVALKCLHSVRAGEQATLQQEFRALCHLVHPNLVAKHELFCVDGAWFFTMELVEGADIVQHVLAHEERAERAQATRDAVVQLLCGLAAIHEAGFVHRDVKPSNVLVEAGGRVVLVDFGLVIAREFAEAARGAAGTPLYMAPEQAQGGTPEPAADLYAVGAILFELLTETRWDARLPAPLCDAEGPVRDARAAYALARSDLAHETARDLHALCRNLLAHDPAARPTAAEALARLCPQQPVQRRAPATPTREPSSCFVAREAELAALHAALTRVLCGGPHIVLVHGESGIGKSALLARFADQLRASSSALVLRGRCYERESTPYKVFDGIIVGLTRYLSGLAQAKRAELTADLRAPLQQLFPAFARQLRELPVEARGACARERSMDESERAADNAHGGDARPRAFAALRELLARIARDAPIVMTIDDLQWADLDSVPLLEALCAPSPGLPLLLVGNYRRDEAQTSPFLATLLCTRAFAPALCEVEQLALSALGPAEAHALVTQLAPGRASSELVASAHGVPFLLVEAALSELDLALPARESADVGDLFAARIAGLNERAQALLSVLSVAARPLSVALATQALAGLECGFETVLELAAQRLVRFRDLDGERCLEPYHDRVRELVSARLDAPRVRALHLSLDAAMERLGTDDPLRRVEHLRAAGEQARAAELAVRAAELACAQLAWSRAADLFAAALALSPCHLPALHQRLGNVLSFAGRHAEAAAAYMRASHAAAAAERAQLERLAAQQYVRAGQTTAGLALFDKTLARVGVKLPRSQLWAGAALVQQRLKGLWTRSLFSPEAGVPRRTAPDPARGERLATLEAFYRELWLSHPVQSALAHGRYCAEARLEGPRGLLQALAAEVIVLAFADGPAARAPVARLLSLAEAMTHESGQPYEAAMLLFARAVAAIHADWRPRAAIAPLEQADALMRDHCAGTQLERAWIGMALDNALEVTGQLAKLAEIVRAREQHASERADNLHALRVVSVPLVLLLEDRPEQALAMVAARSSARRECLPLLDFIALGRGTAALAYGGAARAAHDYYEAGRKKLGYQLAFHGSAVAAEHSFTRARNATALYWTTREPALLREVEQRVRRARTFPPLARAYFRVLEASLLRCDGRLCDARAALRSARALLRAAEGEQGVWIVRYREAQLEGSAELLARARAWFTAQGVRHPERWVSLSIPGLDAWA